MRALQLQEIGRPLVAVELPDPAPGPGEVVVRVTAAGICRSDVHYRSGTRSVPRLPLVPGHEVAGVVETLGPDLVPGVEAPPVGTRVALHYLVRCGRCPWCESGREQFCEQGAMIGLSRDGGYADRIVMAADSLVPIPDAIGDQEAAVMMCSSATALHALRRGRLAPGETVAVFGVGGLGASAIQLAFALGASRVFGVDVVPAKLSLAARLGAEPVDAAAGGAGAAIAARGGADVALELVGSPAVMEDAVASLRVSGRAVAVGITHEPMALDPFGGLVLREAEIVGSADHLRSELDELFAHRLAGRLRLDDVISERIPLDADAVNAALDGLERFGEAVRTVIVP